MVSADQVPVNSAHSKMRWHNWVVLITGSTGSALRAVRPPNLHITPAHHTEELARIPLPRKRGGFPVTLTLGHHRPRHPGDLVRQRDGSTLGGPSRQQRREPGSMLGAVDLRIADDRESASHEQAT